MSLNIKDEETCRLVGELARLTGETMTGAITAALRERLQREKRQRDVARRVEEIHPQFLRELAGWLKHDRILDLSAYLAQNFLRYDGRGEVPSPIHAYLSTNFKELRNLPKDDYALRVKAKDRWYVADPQKATDLPELRTRGLLREFDEYRASPQRGPKLLRLEAVRTGLAAPAKPRTTARPERDGGTRRTALAN